MFLEPSSQEEFLAAVSVPRAVVLLSVNWSTHSRKAVVTFRKAVSSISEIRPQMNPNWIVVDEDCAWVQQWLTEIGFPGYGDGVPRGAGAIAWIEAGQLVDSEMGGYTLSSDEIIERTLNKKGSG